jgi:hypothetical protein
MDDERLVASLAHPNAWWRETAQRLLVERRAVGAEAAMRTMASRGSELARLHARWTLDALALLRLADVQAALRDEAAGVREQGGFSAVAQTGPGHVLRQRPHYGRGRTLVSAPHPHCPSRAGDHHYRSGTLSARGKRGGDCRAYFGLYGAVSLIC